MTEGGFLGPADSVSSPPMGRRHLITLGNLAPKSALRGRRFRDEFCRMRYGRRITATSAKSSLTLKAIWVAPTIAMVHDYPYFATISWRSSRPIVFWLK
jgi:hypothetical protein